MISLINYDSRVWSNSEVVIKFTQIYHQITIIFPYSCWFIAYENHLTINHHY